MSTLEQRLHDDLTTAIRSRDEVTSATLRMALTAIKNEAVSGTEARELSDQDVVGVLGREAKKRREAATAYDDAGRSELAERERAELGVLEGYLPAQLGDDELAGLVAEAIAETGADSPKQMGQVMKVLTPRIAGRADGGRVAAAVKQALSA
ncbi:MAG TPA: GatB/YqeY domain-containing protein [Candidatus Nanopelagicales bacterium]|nr:GatB/YqeY domain-containing protein [Candidatus Nanopelagicales bacterium]